MKRIRKRRSKAAPPPLATHQRDYAEWVDKNPWRALGLTAAVVLTIVLTVLFYCWKV